MSTGVTKESLSKKFKDQPYHMVVIYADWCGHCQHMKQFLGDKFKSREDLTFYSEDKVDRSFKDYFPHVYVFNYGKARDTVVEELYDLLDVDI